jgi:hypothetical protein
MYDAAQELERFSTNAWQRRAEGLWYTIAIGLGSQADEVQAKFLEVMGSWLRITEPVHRIYGLPCERERFPPPEELAPRLPDWFMATFAADSDQEIVESDWRFVYASWLWAMEERCWNWWGYKRNGESLTIQLQVDGWPCPTGELVYLARVAGAESVIVDETLVYRLDARTDQE